MSSFINLLMIIIATHYLAFIYENAAIMTLAYMQMAFLAVSFPVLLFRKFTVKGRLEIPAGISEPGRETAVKIIVTNKSFFPVRRMKAFVIVKDVIRGTKQSGWMKLSEVSQGENTLVRNISFPGSGNYSIMLKKLRVYDWTGLLHGDIRIKSRKHVQVIPALYEVPVRLTAATKNFYGESDVYDEHRSGYDNSELFQVREYQKGDRLQNIHWKLTAKQDMFMVKEHSLPKSCPVVLLLDFHPKKHLKKQERLILYMEVAASLSFSIMNAGCPHYVVWYDSAGADIDRLRVEDEESLFYFIGVLMQINWEHPEQAGEGLVRRYREKYRMEPYVWALSLDEKLLLKKEEEILVQFSEKELEKSLAQVELLL